MSGYLKTHLNQAVLRNIVVKNDQNQNFKDIAGISGPRGVT